MKCDHNGLIIPGLAEILFVFELHILPIITISTHTFHSSKITFLEIPYLLTYMAGEGCMQLAVCLSFVNNRDLMFSNK